MPKINIAQDSRGNYRRDLGWKQIDGKRIQHRFYLGRDLSEAMVRIGRLDQCWEAVAVRWRREIGPGEPAWDDTTLAIATAVARGDTEVRVAVPIPAVLAAGGPLFLPFVQTWLYEIRLDFPMIDILPAQEGMEEDLSRFFEQHRQDRLEEAERHRQDAVLSALACERALIDAGCFADQTLHTALDRYADWLRTHHATPDGIPTERAVTLGRVVKQVQDHSDDIPLHRFRLDTIEDLIGYWSRRPISPRFNRPMAVDTCRDTIKLIRRFIDWLHKSAEFDWRKPEDYARTPVRIRIHADERKTLGRQVQTYSLDDLGTLWEYARPKERAMILLGLNCGFGASEVGSLRVDELFLDHTDEGGRTGSWIKAVRRKTGVYGEFELWPETVRGIRYVLARRGEAAAPTLFVTKTGEALTKSTASGNHGQKIPNMWNHLRHRVLKDHPQLQVLSFNKLRKTGANLVRQYGSDEVASMYLCHGRTSDDPLLEVYTNRPFGKVFEALGRVRPALDPMFARVAEPFPEGVRQSGPIISLGKVKEIRRLREKGLIMKEIAELTGTSVSTVQRHLKD